MHARDLSLLIALAVLLLLLIPLFKLNGRNSKRVNSQLKPTLDLFMVSAGLLVLLGIMGSDLKYTPFGRMANFFFVILGGVGIMMYRELQRKFRDEDFRRSQTRLRQIQQGSQSGNRPVTPPPPPPAKEQFDPYKTLGLPADASKQEVTVRYRELVNQFHPDRLTEFGPDLQKVAHERMLEVQKAYDLLKRKK